MFVLLEREFALFSQVKISPVSICMFGDCSFDYIFLVEIEFVCGFEGVDEFLIILKVSLNLY